MVDGERPQERKDGSGGAGVDVEGNTRKKKLHIRRKVSRPLMQMQWKIKEENPFPRYSLRNTPTSASISLYNYPFIPWLFQISFSYFLSLTLLPPLSIT